MGKEVLILHMGVPKITGTILEVLMIRSRIGFLGSI